MMQNTGGILDFGQIASKFAKLSLSSIPTLFELALPPQQALLLQYQAQVHFKQQAKAILRREGLFALSSTLAL